MPDFATGLRSGIALIRLLEALTGKTLEGYLKVPLPPSILPSPSHAQAPANTAECLTNLEMFLRGVMTVGVSRDSITSEDLYLGREPLIVLLLIRLALKFRNTPISMKSTFPSSYLLV